MTQLYTAKLPRTEAVEFTGDNKTEILEWVGSFPELTSWGGCMNFRDNDGVLECKWVPDTTWLPVNVGDIVAKYPGSEGAQCVPGVDFYEQWEPIS